MILFLFHIRFILSRNVEVFTLFENFVFRILREKTSENLYPWKICIIFSLQINCMGRNSPLKLIERVIVIDLLLAAAAAIMAVELFFSASFNEVYLRRTSHFIRIDLKRIQGEDLRSRFAIAPGCCLLILLLQTLSTNY